MAGIELRVTAFFLALAIFAKLGGFVGASLAGGNPPPAPAELQPAFDLAGYGAEVYAQRCSKCHAIRPGEPSLAPPLHGLLGRRAGSAPGYAYSFKFEGSSLMWDEGSLYAWLARTTIATPDIRQRHVGLADAIEREAVVAYIKGADR